MSSVFAKLRKQAKEKAKRPVNVESTSEQFAKKEMKEIEPVTKEELDSLLQAVNEKPEETPSVETKPVAVEEVNTDVVFEAIGVYFNKTTRKFVKVVIKYNPITKESAVESVEDMTDNSLVAASKVGQYYSLKLMRQSESL